MSLHPTMEKFRMTETRTGHPVAMNVTGHIPPLTDRIRSSIAQHPAHWAVAAWFWLDLPTFCWWCGLVSLPGIWHSSAAVLFSSRSVDHAVSAAWYGIGVGILVVSYRPLTVWLEREHRKTHAAIAAILGLAAVSFPFVSHDVFAYFGEWRMMALYHQNPMVTPIVSIPHWRADRWLLRGGWVGTINPYGPAWFLMVRLMGWAAPQGFLGFFIVWKSVCVGLALSTAGLLNKLRRGSGMRFLAHPVIAIELLANAHNDLAMVALMVGAYVLWTRQRWVFAGLAAGLSVATKYISLCFLLWIWAAAPGWKQRLLSAAAAVLAGLAALSVFWVGPKTLVGPLSSTHLFLRSPAFVVQGVLVHLAGIPRLESRHLAILSTTVLFLVVLLDSGRKFLKNRDPIHMGDAMLAAALVFMSWLQFWYIVWALPFYILYSRPRAIRMTSYLAYLELVRAVGWPMGLPTAMQLVQIAFIWGGLGWYLWPQGTTGRRLPRWRVPPPLRLRRS